MKSLSFLELKNMADWLNQELVGAQLQDIWTYDQGLVLQFYRFKEIFFWVDANNSAPLISLLEAKPPFAKKQKPISPFLNSNAKNMRWSGGYVDPAKGRILMVELKNSQQICEIQIELIPKAFNLVARVGEKKISWAKPRDLPLSQNPIESLSDLEVDWYEHGRQHLQGLIEPQAKGWSHKEDPRPRAIEKKQRALADMRKLLDEANVDDWQAFGEHLKHSSEVPAQFEKFYKSQMSVAENRDNAFHQAKLLKKKRAGTLERMQILEAEILNLKEDLVKTPFESLVSSLPSSGQKLIQKSDSKARRLQLSPQIDAVMGKSAKDNLAILRQAQPTDLWLHLKDEPSAHVIIAKPKNLEVSAAYIQKAAEWLMTEMFSKKKERLAGRYEVIVVECRHVKPIKGDKHGRVTHHHSRTFSFVFSHASN